MNDLDTMLGTLVKVRLLRALYRMQQPVSGRHAARLAGVSHKAAGSLDELAAIGILEKQESTGQHLYRFRREHFLAASVTELFAAEEQKLRSALAVLASALAPSDAIVSAAIYGSVARGDAQPGSDLDVLALLSRKGAEQAVLDQILDVSREVSQRFGWLVSPHLMQAAEWSARIARRDPVAVSAMNDSVVFLGEPLDAAQVDG